MIEVALPGATALFTGRAGGVSAAPYASLNLGPWTDDDPAAVAENRRRVAARAGRRLLAARQVHGTVVARDGAAPANAEGAAAARSGAVPDEADGQATAASGAVPDEADGQATAGSGAVPDEADGQATARHDVAALVLTADCLPVAVAGEGAVAMLHAGWRGLSDGVLEEGVRAVRALGAAGPLEAAIGPAAGGCCYEVGPEVAARFPDWALDGRLLDLKVVAARRLRDAGVAAVHDVGRCTMCEPDVFFSHRRSGPATGRQGGLVWRS